MFLIKQDYYRRVKGYVLDDLTESIDEINRATAEAVEKVAGYLSARYDLPNVFFNLLEFNSSATYQVDDYIFVQANAFSLGTNYVVGDLVEGEFELYECIQANNDKELSDSQYWEKFKGLPIYRTKQTSQGNLPSNTTYFVQEDPRSALVVGYCLDVAVFNLYSLLEPDEIDEGVEKRHDNVIAELKLIQKQIMNPSLPVPEDGSKEELLFGSMPKRSNSFS